jgi:hypothetical protein
MGIVYLYVIGVVTVANEPTFWTPERAVKYHLAKLVSEKVPASHVCLLPDSPLAGTMYTCPICVASWVAIGTPKTRKWVRRAG